MKRRRGRRPGRPRKLAAKRRTATTVADRQPIDDPGTAELRRHRIAATTQDALPDDLFGTLYGRACITANEYRTSLEFADLVHVMRRGLGLTEASPAGAWRNILSAAHVAPTLDVTASPAAEYARRALARFRRDLDDLAWRAVTDAVDGVWWPGETDRFLGQLHVALEYLGPRLPLFRRSR